MYNITNGSASEAWTVDIELCGKPHHMEIDSGATKTVISEVTYDAIRDTVDLTKSNSVLSTYTGEKIPVLGKVTLHVGYGGQDYKLLALVVKGAGQNLLGRDWRRVIKMNWKTRFKGKEDHPELSQVLELYNEVFKDELGTLKGTKEVWIDSVEDGCVLWGTRVVIPSSGISAVLTLWYPPRNFEAKGPGLKLCMVAGHGPRYWRPCAEVRAMPTTPEGTCWSATTPVGMAKRTLDTAVRRLCRTIQRGDVLDRSGRLFQITRSRSDEINNF